MAALFTYGSLMCADIMYQVAGCRPTAVAATLSGYCRSRLQGRDYPAIFPAAGGVVTGILYLDLAKEALRRLDIFEGELYCREELEVTASTRQPAQAYVLRPEHHRLLSGEPWDFAAFQKNGKQAFCRTYLGFGRIDDATGP
jgi:gamma-glutamylcyclotransferase (GGCT)/AIG2-like uncharacterized protein YtfP